MVDCIACATPLEHVIIDGMRTKECRHCGATKSLDQYERSVTAKDGHRNQCKSCRNRWRRQWLKKHPEKRRAYNRQERNTANGRKRHRLAERRRYWADIEKSRAYNRAWDSANRIR